MHCVQVMQECFEAKDIAKLQKVIEAMEKGKAEYHMRRCVSSGLWVPEANKGVEKKEEESEEEYEDAPDGETKPVEAEN